MSNKKRTIFKIYMKKRLTFVYFIIFVCFLALIGRLVKLNIEDGERYKKKVLSQQSYISKVIPYKRGDILDRKGTLLATSEKVYNLILDPKEILTKNSENEQIYKDSTISALVTYFGLDKNNLLEILSNRPDSQYVILLKTLTDDDIESFLIAKQEEKSNIRGVWFEEDYIRKYPYSNLACDLIGFTSQGNVGNWGIEEYYNDSLNGLSGREYGYYDSELNLVRTVKNATDGHTVYSTIDVNIQMIVEKYMKEFNETIGSSNMGVVIMNPNNAEILAMASTPTFDLNNPRELTEYFTEEEIEDMSEEESLNALNQIWRNFCISDSYEPGSPYKVFTVATGYEEAKLNKEDTYICDGGEIVVAGEKRISCNKKTGHGLITLEETIMYSCNDALMQIAKIIGKELFIGYQKSFGIGERTGIDLPGEASASNLMHTLSSMGPVELATESFGQAFNVTMIQLANGFCSLVNGGYLYQPQVVKQIVNESGGLVQNSEPIIHKETVSKSTSDTLRKYLLSTVESGTAQGAKIEGYAVGGKTGTAEKLPRGNEKYVVSFIGAVPMDSPELVIYVVIDEPNVPKKDITSSFATNLAQKILIEVLPYQNIFPSTEPIEEETTEETTKEDTEETTEEEGIVNLDGEVITNSEDPQNEYRDEPIWEE